MGEGDAVIFAVLDSIIVGVPSETLCFACSAVRRGQTLVE